MDVDRQLERALLHVQTLQWHHTGVQKSLQKDIYVNLVEDSLEVFRVSYTLAYFLTNVVSEFVKVGEMFGDYGAITTSRVLHPLLDQLDDMTRRIHNLCSALDDQPDALFVLAPALRRESDAERMPRLRGEAQDTFSRLRDVF